MSSEEAGGGSDTERHDQPQRFPSTYFKEKPVKVGEEIDVTISEISKRGDGVARIQGYVIFIPNTKQGQQARVKITTIRPNFAIAEVLNPPT